jgi:hypothetical protein
MHDQSKSMRSESYIREAIIQLLSLRLRSGSSVKQLEEFVASCIRDASKSVKTADRHQGLDIHRLGSILRTWHTETKFLNKDGLPRPLQRSGRNSMRSLITAYYPSSKADLVFKRLRATGLIKANRRAGWLPTGRHARISQLSFETLEHLSEGVARYVETVINNVTTTNDREVLFERSCKVTRLPSGQFESFRDYVGEQAIAFITAIDDWLESRNAPSDSKASNHRTAGVYTFAYIDRRKRAGRR